MGTKAKSEKKLSFQERLKRFVEQARGAARICRRGLTETSCFRGGPRKTNSY
jgi:hypothetical protein